MLRYSHLALLFTCFLAMVSGLSFSARPAQASLGVSHAPSTGLDAALAGSLVPPTQVPDQTQVAASLGRAPVMFIENVGQFDSDARFQVRGGNGSIYLADDAIWFTLLERPNVHPARRRQPSTLNRFHTRSEDKPRKGENLKLSFVGANAHPTLEPFNRLDAHVSYFIGSDRSKWHANVPVWGGVRYKDLYPGIDLEITSENGHIVQRVVARGGADLNAVRLRVDGADKMTLDADRLRVTTAVGEYTVPLLQVTGAGSAKLPRPAIAENQVSSPFGNPQFAAAGPQMGASDLLYSTYLGGDYDDDGIDIAVDSSGAAYVTGLAGFSDFPTTPGAFDTSFNGGCLDAFVVKLNGAGSALIYATFLGGSGDDYGLGIGVDSSGSAYVTGLTGSSDFPTTRGAFDTSFNGGDHEGYYSDAFVVKLNAAGSALTYSTFLGGRDDDEGDAVAIDSSGAAYVTGGTLSSNFPTTPGAFDTTFNGGDYDGYYADAFVVKLNRTGSALTYSTFFGGRDDEESYGIALDSSGSAYVTGWTDSADFPATPGAFDTTCGTDGMCNFDGTFIYSDVFVVKLNRTGSALASGTFLGGHAIEFGYGIALDSSGSAYVTGETWSSDFPTTPGAFDTSFGGGDEYDDYGDAYVVKLAIPTTAIENDDPSIQYNGWRGVSDPNSNGGTYRVSNVKNDQVTFKFKGTSIKWLTFKGPDQGQAQVTIDSVDRGTVRLYSPTRQWNIQQTYNTYSGLLNTNYTISIKVLGTKNPSATDYSVVVDGFIVGATSTQENACALKYSTWTCLANLSASGGSYRYAGTKGAVASLTFDGTSINWITGLGPNYGKAQVLIDGVNKGTVDLYAPKPQWRVVKSYTGLAAGTHTIQIKVLGIRNIASTGTRVVLDAFNGAITPLSTAVQIAPQPPDAATEDEGP